MKKFFLFFFICFYLLPVISDAQIPALNAIILDYVKTVIGKKVGKGECWDLAHDALTIANAQWDQQYAFGKEINPLKDSVFPGDLIHFKKVVLKYEKNNALYTENYPQHTAIIYKIISAGEYQIAHQNTDFSGKKVGLSTIRLADKKSGKMQFYRPQAKD
jgi:hypothetical protein